LFFLAITISFIGGFTTPVIKQKEWVIVTGFVLLACCIIYITLDMARPMRGFIRPESGEQRIEELQRMLQ
jgi:thiosulfate reductase cytochrome b subunit